MALKKWPPKKMSENRGKKCLFLNKEVEAWSQCDGCPQITAKMTVDLVPF